MKDAIPPWALQRIAERRADEHGRYLRGWVLDPDTTPPTLHIYFGMEREADVEVEVVLHGADPTP